MDLPQDGGMATYGWEMDREMWNLLLHAKAKAKQTGMQGMLMDLTSAHFLSGEYTAVHEARGNLALCAIGSVQKHIS